MPPGLFGHDSFYQIGFFVAYFANLIDFLRRRYDFFAAITATASATAAAAAMVFGAFLVGLFKLPSDSKGILGSYMYFLTSTLTRLFFFLVVVLECILEIENIFVN